MKQRRARHKHQTWKAYRFKASLARRIQFFANYMIMGSMRPGFVRSMLMPREQLEAERRRWRAEYDAMEQRQAAEIAALPSLTRFK